MRKIFSTIIAGLAAMCGLTAFGAATADENGITPTHWYKFDGNLTSFGSSSLTFGGEKGDSYTPSDNDGQAYLFKSGYHPWGDSGMSRGSGDFTVTTVARTANLNNGIIWSMGTKGTARSLNLVATNATQVALRISGSTWSSTGENVITATVNDATARYHVYTLTYTQSTKTFALYVDTNTTAAGTKVMSEDVAANFTAANFQFGSMNQGCGYGMTQGYGIALDDFRLYQQLLTSDQIAKICATFPVDTVYATSANFAYASTDGAALAAEAKTITVKGSGNYGASITNNDNTAITSHFVFDGGKSSTYIWGNSGSYTLVNYADTDTTPWMEVKNGTELTFYGHDVGGWNSARQSKAYVKVDDGATLKMENVNANGTFYFPGVLELDAGATLALNNPDSGTNIRFVGGADTDAIVVPSVTADATTTTATIDGPNSIGSAQEDNPGMSFNVGDNATLLVNAELKTQKGTYTIKKRGNGTLKFRGGTANYGNTFEIVAGTVNTTTTFGGTVAVDTGATLELDPGEDGTIALPTINWNGGDITVKSGTLNLGTTRTAKGVDFEDGTAVLAEATAAEVTAGTISVDYLPESIESITIVTPDNRVFTAQRDDKGVATVTLTAATAVQGSNCLLDYTFNKETLYKRLATTSIVSTGSDTGALGYDTGYSASNSYNTDNGALLVKSTPYKTQTWPDNYTVAVYANVPDAEKCCLMAFGTETDGYIAIVRGSSANEILLVKGTGDVACDTVATMAADNATVAKHLVVFTKDGTTYKVYCDGVKVAEKTIESFTLGSGFQIGSIHGGVGTKTGISRVSALTGEAKDAVEVGAIRVFNKVLTSDEMSLLTAEFPYASKGGHFTRTISGDANLSETGAWAKDDDTETYALPDGTAEAGITYKPSATITTTADATLTLNESLSLDRLTLDGSSKLTIVANEGKTLDTTGAVIVNGTLQFKYVDVDIHASPLQLGTNGKVIIDLTGMDTKPLMVEKTTLAVQLTGTTDETTDGVTVINKPTLLGRTLDLVFDNGNYWLKVTPDHTAGANLYFQSGYWSTTKDTFKVALTKGGSATAFLSGDTIVFDKDYTAEGQGDGVYLDSTAVGTTIGVNSDFYFHTGADATILSNKVITIAAGKTLTINKAYNHAIDLGPVTFNGGTVKLGDGVTVSGAVKGTSTIQIDAGSTVTINAGGSIANTISGAGTLKITTPTKVTLAEGWTGNVTLSGGTYGGSAQPLSGYVNENSTLTLNGWKGWLASETIAEITVTDPDEETYGMNVSDGSSYDTWNYVFTKVKGTGTIATTKEGGASFQPVLIRDVSAFSGKFAVTAQSILVTDRDIDYSTTYAQQFFVDADKTVAVESVTAPKVVVNGTLKVKKALTVTPTTTTTGNAIYTTTEGDYTVYTSESVGATIGDVNYKTLSDAIAAVKDGQTVTLAKSITLDAARIDVKATGDITIDLGGNTVTPTAACGNGSAFDVKTGNVMFINGTIDGTAITQTEEQAKAYDNECDAITVRPGATATLGEDLVIKVNSITGSCAYPFKSSTTGIANAKLYVTAGSYSNAATVTGPDNELGMCFNQGNVSEQLVIVTGGTMTKDPTLGDNSSKGATTFLAEHYYVTQDAETKLWTVAAQTEVTPVIFLSATTAESTDADLKLPTVTVMFGEDYVTEEMDYSKTWDPAEIGTITEDTTFTVTVYPMGAYYGDAKTATFTVTYKASDPTPTDPEDGSSVTKNEDGSVTVSNTTDTATITIPEGCSTTIKVAGTVDKLMVNGTLDTGKLVVLSKNGTVITGLCKIEAISGGYSVALDPEKTTPAISDTTAAETTPADGKVSCTAEPGLTYTLKRAEKVGEVKTGTTADKTVASDTTVTLTDKLEGTKPATAFYIIEVTK